MYMVLFYHHKVQLSRWLKFYCQFWWYYHRENSFYRFSAFYNRILNFNHMFDFYTLIFTPLPRWAVAVVTWDAIISALALLWKLNFICALGIIPAHRSKQDSHHYDHRTVPHGYCACHWTNFSCFLLHGLLSTQFLRKILSTIACGACKPGHIRESTKERAV